jgi:Mg/Co/Ni transporter MgtE
MNLNSVIKKQITVGFLLGAMCFTLILWSLSYLQGQVDAFAEYTYSEYY